MGNLGFEVLICVPGDHRFHDHDFKSEVFFIRSKFGRLLCIHFCGFLIVVFCMVISEFTYFVEEFL